MQEFLDNLTTEQLKGLRHILKYKIEGDIDLFIFKIKKELDYREDFIEKTIDKI